MEILKDRAMNMQKGSEDITVIKEYIVREPVKDNFTNLGLPNLGELYFLGFLVCIECAVIGVSAEVSLNIALDS